jgi:hypothetical protein
MPPKVTSVRTRLASLLGPLAFRESPSELLVEREGKSYRGDSNIFRPRGGSSGYRLAWRQRRKSFAFRETEVKALRYNRQHRRTGYGVEANIIRCNSIIGIGATITLMKFP